ncbi:MAG: oligosaccharyl transferase, archaeosortase A system-associated [Methanoregula sp.]
MFFDRLKRFQSPIIFLILLSFMIFTIWIRGLNAVSIDLPHYITLRSPDIWYNFRQIELMIHNYPVYSWFDPMTAYPTGKSIDWGPFLPFLAASLSLITGMTERPDMMFLASWLIPVFGALMVPVTYFIGKLLRDWKTGITAAGLITVASIPYFYTSSFGNVDHHILEAFFGALFCLLYLQTLLYAKKNSPSVKNKRIFITFFGLSVVTAIVFFTGFLNMPTMVLFGFIVAIYTLLQFIRDTWENKLETGLALTNIAVFTPVILFMAIFGIKQPGMSPGQYSIVHIIFILLIIGETLILYILSKQLIRNKKFYIISVVAIGTGLLIAMDIISKETFVLIFTLFGQPADIATITESQPWSLPLAFASLNITLILGIIGFAIIIYHLYIKKRPEHLFFAIWSVIIFALTVQHLRFEYYFALNVVLLSSVCIVTALETGLADVGISLRGLSIPSGGRFLPTGQPDNKIQEEKPVLKKHAKYPEKPSKKRKELSSPQKLKNKQIFGSVVVIVILGATIISVGLSVRNDIEYSSNPVLLIDKNWIETAEWLNNQTPDPGVDYYGVHQNDTFEYPGSAYGILSWWDFGHYITFIGKRIPVTNPFQDHLTGPAGAAAFFMADSEADATGILQEMGARYVITDTSLATDQFGDLITWNNSTSNIYPYMMSFFFADPNSKNQLIQFNGERGPYFRTMITRLHNFDGSMQTPRNITYLEYYEENRNGWLYPMVTTTKYLNVSDTDNAIKKFESQHQGNAQAILVGQYLEPLERVPALQHFRLVHESYGNSPDILIYDNSGAQNLKLVKVFEVVKGAHIKGDGVIELQVVTNTGRAFTYRQESMNGEFIVPYSTINNPYEVKARGKYHILGTGDSVDITEEDVINGNEVKP